MGIMLAAGRGRGARFQDESVRMNARRVARPEGLEPRPIGSKPVRYEILGCCVAMFVFRRRVFIYFGRAPSGPDLLLICRVGVLLDTRNRRLNRAPLSEKASGRVDQHFLIQG